MLEFVQLLSHTLTLTSYWVTSSQYKQLPSPHTLPRVQDLIREQRMVMNWHISVASSATQYSKNCLNKYQKFRETYLFSRFSDFYLASQKEHLHWQLLAYKLVWFICSSFLFVTFVCLCVLFGLCHRLYTSVTSELAAFLAVALHTGWRCGLTSSGPQHLLARPCPQCADTPKAQLISAGF